MIFAKPYLLWLLLLLIPIAAWYIWKRKSLTAKMKISTIEPFRGMGRSYKAYLQPLPIALEIMALAMTIVVLARPQAKKEWDNKKTEGIDVVLAMDISASMLAEDLQPNRITAARDVATDFAIRRKDDNIGLVVFAGASCSVCPLTTDKECISSLIAEIDTGMVTTPGTAIGVGLASAVSRLKDSKAKSKVIILLTDGSDTGGSITPQKGAELAKAMGIRVYTIGVGTNGMARMPMIEEGTGRIKKMMTKVEIDEKTLKEIAAQTNGKYFRATSTDELGAVYQTIDKLEKSTVTISNFSKRKELYLPFALIGLACLLLGLTLQATILKHNP